MYLCRLFWDLVLTQPFSLDCHHTLSFWSLTKVRKNKSIRWSRITCNNFKRLHLSSHPLQFLEICKRGNSQLVVYNSSTEGYMNKLHAADVETSFSPSVLWYKHDQWWYVIPFCIHPIPSPKKSLPWKLMTPSPPNSWVGDTDIARLRKVIIYFNAPALSS